MTSELDLLPVPAERDLPPGRLELRAAAVVAAVEAGPARGRLRRWVGSLVLILASVAAVCSVVFADAVRPHETATAAKTAAVVVAGSGAVALALALRPPQLAHQ